MGKEAGQIEGAFNAEVSRLVEAKRKQCGWSKTALARELGVHRNTLARWENGDPIPFWHLLRLADRLSCGVLLLMPAPELVWGAAAVPFKKPVRYERDPYRLVRFERDPRLTAEERKMA